MAKPKYGEQNFQEFLESTFPTYESLMKRSNPLVQQIRRRGTDEDKESLKKILRLSLAESAKKLAGEEKINLQYIQSAHPGLDRVARTVYSRKDGKSPWRQVCESAGLVYPCRAYKEWNLSKLLDAVSFLSDDRSKMHGKREYYESNPVGVARRLVGNYGKAFILAGIDYLKFPRIKRDRSIYSFSGEDLERILRDESLGIGRKISSIFNVLSLQHYDIYDEMTVQRTQEELDGYRICKQKAFFDELSVTLSQLQNLEDLCAFAVSIELDGTVNRFYRQNFLFSCEGAGFYSTRMHYYLNDKLSFVAGQVKKS